METKRFIGSDVLRLYDRVRREFGPDAVIVRTRTLMRDGADPLIELTAGPAPAGQGIPLEAQQTMLEGTLTRLDTHQPGMTVGELEDQLFRVEEEIAAETDSAAAELADCLESMAVERGHLRLEPLHEMTASTELTWAPQPRPVILAHPHNELIRRDAVVELDARRRRPDRPALVHELQNLGFTPKAAQTIVEQSASSSIRAAVAETLSAQRVRHPDDGQTSIISVQGIAGSGRTTALMKMAVDCVDGGTDAVLVTADEATRDEIYAFGIVLGLPVYEATDATDVAMIAQAVPEGACIFVDVPPGKWTAPHVTGVARYAYLAIPADRNPRALTLALAGMNTRELAGALLTFTDRASTLNPSLSLVIEAGLGVAFLSDGSDVSAGIRLADHSMLASGILTTASGETTDGRAVATA